MTAIEKSIAVDSEPSSTSDHAASLQMNPKTLLALVELLNRNGTNYTVFLKCYSVPVQFGALSEQLIRAALGVRAVVGGVQTVTPSELSMDVQSSLSFAGDSGAGPDPGAIHSEDFDTLVATLLADIDAVARVALRVEQFWLKEGHPAYPVFWDFAYLFTTASEAVCLIGSSSD